MRQRSGRSIDRLSRLAIAAVLLAGGRRRDPGAVVNAVLAYAGTWLPHLAERRVGVAIRGWQRAYVDAALLTHAVGMLGPYDDVWWWDHLAHALSASVVGGVAFAAARRRGRDPRRAVLGGVLGLGLLWEAVEYVVHRTLRRVGLEPILVFYSRRDTLLDLLWDLVGGLAVLLLGDRLLENLLRRDP